MVTELLLKRAFTHTGESCWSTSHQDCEKKQLIDLGFEGFDPHFMDEFQPEIKICEWYMKQSFCMFQYNIHVTANIYSTDTFNFIVCVSIFSFTRYYFTMY